MAEIPDDLRTDHLFLLVGTNPLPNYVAPRLLAKPTTTIWLLHSDGSGGNPNTEAAARRLEEALLELRSADKLRFADVLPRPIPDSDAQAIEGQVARILTTEVGSGSIGLNYTGGTKPMSVHVYRTIERVGAERGLTPVFSYLDPRKLALRVDPRGNRSQQVFPILTQAGLRSQVEIGLDELAALHGYERVQEEKPGEWASVDDDPALLPVCEAIARAHADPDGFGEWRAWVKTERCASLPDAGRYPHLGSVRSALDTLHDETGVATPDSVASRLQPHKPNPNLTSCSKWFVSGWLEEYASVGFRQGAAQAGLHARDIGLKYRRSGQVSDNFELDAAALQGYQLFAVSCIASEKKEKAKEHLFECYVRGRQLGGDEARIGLVCLVEDKGALLNEIVREWDGMGKIQVFDRHALERLPEAITGWIATASL